MNTRIEAVPLFSVEQERARHALQCIDDVCKQKDEFPSYYDGEARKLPVRIMASGLGQALAFLFAKADTEKSRGKAIEKLVKDLSNRVIPYLQLAPPSEAIEKDTLIRILVDGDIETLRRATDESLAWLKWLIRFAEGRGLGKLKKKD